MHNTGNGSRPVPLLVHAETLTNILSRSELATRSESGVVPNSRRRFHQSAQSCAFTVTKTHVPSWQDTKDAADVVGHWPPDLILQACRGISNFAQAEEAMELLKTQSKTLNPSQLGSCILHLVFGMCKRMSAAHLFPALTTLVLNAADRIVLQFQITRPDKNEKRLVDEMLAVYAFFLLNYDDWRARQAAIDVLAWASENDVAGRFSRLLAICCGVPFLGKHIVNIGTTASVPFDAGYAGFAWEFWQESLWPQMHPIVAAVRNPNDEIVYLGSLAQSAAHSGKLDKADQYFRLALTKTEGGWDSFQAWQYATVAYLSCIPRASHDFESLSKLCDDYGVAEFPESSLMTLWSSLLHRAGHNEGIPASWLVNLISSEPAADEPLGFVRRFDLRQGPPLRYLNDGTICESLSSALSRRFIDPGVLEALRTIWTLQKTRDLPRSTVTLHAILRTCIQLELWQDFFLVCRKMCSTQTQAAAVENLKINLQSHSRVSIPTTDSDLTELFDWHVTTATPEAKALCRVAMLRHCISAAYRRQVESMDDLGVVYALWKHVPRALSARPPCDFCLRFLLRSALHIDKLETSAEDKPKTKWDRLSPSFQARIIFREILYSQFPELQKLNLVEPLLQSLKRNQAWEFPQALEDKTWERRLRAFCSERSSRRPPSPSSSRNAYDDFEGFTRPAPWTTIAISEHSFQFYNEVLLCIRYLLRFGDAWSWQEPLEMLAIMRHLGVKPTLRHLCDIVIVLKDGPSRMDKRTFAESFDEHEPPLGPLHDWCAEWIPEAELPTHADVKARTDFPLHPLWNQGSKLGDIKARKQARRFRRKFNR